MAGMWRKVPGGLLGLMAGGAAAPEEAEAVAFPNGIRDLERFLVRSPDGSLPQPGGLQYRGNGFRNNVGTMEDKAFQAWKALGQAPSNGSNLVESSAHPLVHRYNKKPRQTLSQTEQDMMDLLNDKEAALVTNYNRQPGQYGLLGTAKDGAQIFAPLQHGQQKTYIKTVFRPNNGQLQRMNEIDSAGRRLNPPCMNTQNALIPQPVPISAVGRVKRTLPPALIIASGSEGSGHGKNQPEYIGSPDLPLETPVFDPIDILAGGFYGGGRNLISRLAGMAGDAAVNLTPGLLDFMMNKIFPPKDGEEKKTDVSRRLQYGS